MLKDVTLTLRLVVISNGVLWPVKILGKAPSDRLERQVKDVLRNLFFPNLSIRLLQERLRQSLSFFGVTSLGDAYKKNKNDA